MQDIIKNFIAIINNSLETKKAFTHDISYIKKLYPYFFGHSFFTFSHISKYHKYLRKAPGKESL